MLFVHAPIVASNLCLMQWVVQHQYIHNLNNNCALANIFISTECSAI